MTSILLKNSDAVLPDKVLKNASILIEDGFIKDIFEFEATADEVIDLKNSTVFAGFIDLHNHGAVGVDVNEASAEDFCAVGRFLASNGVTAWMPTFVPDSENVYRKVIAQIDELMQTQSTQAIAQIVGVHYEGVFANTEMCGALRPEFFKTFSGRELDELPRLKTGAHLTTFAPEIAGGVELVKELKKQNWIPSIGHTKADFDVLEEVFEAGARHLTHFFNAMSGLHHREVGVVGWALARDVTFDIIADGIHVHPEILKLAVQWKTPEKISLISDSVAPTGLGDGRFNLWGEEISVTNGRTQNERGSIAGSVMTMADAVRTFRAIDVADIEISKMASRNPARLIGLEQTHGTLEKGKRADLTVIDADGKVVLTMIGGRMV